MGKYKFKHFERYAIFKAYDGRCFYTGELLDFRNFDIDHIISEYYLDHPDEFQQIKLEYGLKDDFKINSYYNWAPCHPYWNKKKHKTPFSKHATLTFLDVVRKKVQKVLDIEEKIKRKAEKNEILANLGIKLELGYISPAEVISFVNELSSYNIDDFEYFISNIHLLLSNVPDFYQILGTKNDFSRNFGMKLEEAFIKLFSEHFKVIPGIKRGFWDFGIEIADNFIPFELKVQRVRTASLFHYFEYLKNKVIESKINHFILLLMTPFDFESMLYSLTNKVKLREMSYVEDELNKKKNLYRFKINGLENFDINIIHLKI